MMKIAVLSALLMASSVLAGGPSDFPEYGAFHSHCETFVEDPAKTCAVWYTNIKTTIDKFQAGQGTKRGTYHLDDNDGKSYMMITYESSSNYRDDLMFTFETKGAGCVVTTKSRTRTSFHESKYDNYCSIRYVFDDGLMES